MTIQEIVYRHKLERLLGRCEFYVSDDGKGLAPNEMYLKGFEDMLSNPLKVIADVRKDVSDEEVEEIVQLYVKAGGGAKGAYAVVEAAIYTVDGVTVQIKE